MGACERALAVSLPFLRALAVSPPSFSPSSSAPHSSSRFAPRTQKKWQVAGFHVVGEVGSRFGNIVGLTFQARPFHGLRVAGAADNHFLAANNNHDLLEFLLGWPMVFAAAWAFNDLLRKCGKRAVVENPLFD